MEGRLFVHTMVHTHLLQHRPQVRQIDGSEGPWWRQTKREHWPAPSLIRGLGKGLERQRSVEDGCAGQAKNQHRRAGALQPPYFLAWAPRDCLGSLEVAVQLRLGFMWPQCHRDPRVKSTFTTSSSRTSAGPGAGSAAPSIRKSRVIVEGA